MSWPVTERRDQHNRVLIWIEARDHETDDPSPMGLWDGRDHEQFEIEGELRDFYGAGNVQDLPSFTSQAGIVVQNTSIQLAAFSPEVRELVRGRNVRFSPIRIYVAKFHPETGAHIGTDRVFSGVIDAAPEEIGPRGGEARTTLEMVSNARFLTRKLPLLKSQTAQSNRDGDNFFRHADVSGSAEVFWGRERHSG